MRRSDGKVSKVVRKNSRIEEEKVGEVKVEEVGEIKLAGVGRVMRGI